ncbi:MAG: hypothetical protein HYT80_12115 [Euryarchaeota archaeon]|nr:hypothetical protein [Euryarchaeota archaeon]
MDRSGWTYITIAAIAEAFFVSQYFLNPRVNAAGLVLLSLSALLVLALAFWRSLDNFSRGAIVIAALLWAFMVWGGVHNPQENDRNVAISSVLPLTLIGTVLLVWFLQRGET